MAFDPWPFVTKLQITEMRTEMRTERAQALPGTSRPSAGPERLSIIWTMSGLQGACWRSLGADVQASEQATQPSHQATQPNQVTSQPANQLANQLANQPSNQATNQRPNNQATKRPSVQVSSLRSKPLLMMVWGSWILKSKHISCSRGVALVANLQVRLPFLVHSRSGSTCFTGSHSCTINLERSTKVFCERDHAAAVALGLKESRGGWEHSRFCAVVRVQGGFDVLSSRVQR